MYHGCLGTRPDQPCAISQDESVGPIRARRQIESKAMVVSKINGILEKSGFVGIAAGNSEIACIGHEAAEVRHHVRGFRFTGTTRGTERCGCGHPGNDGISSADDHRFSLTLSDQLTVQMSRLRWVATRHRLAPIPARNTLPAK